MTETYHVYGPPGCGKTTFLTGQISKAVESRGVDNVLVASLTKAAAAEMASRSVGLPEKSIGTLHAHCYRQLGSPDIAEKKLDVWNEENKGSNFQLTDESKGSLHEKKMEHKNFGQVKGDSNYGLMNMLRAQMAPKSDWPKAVINFADRWDAWKESYGFMDFTEMIERGINDTWSAPGSPEVLIGDETQDWSVLEMTLFRDHWGSRAEVVMMAGDPDQCIYSWRGADSGCFMNYEIPEGNKRFLKKSYRLAKQPHSYARSLIKRIDNREDVEFSPTDKEGSVDLLNSSPRSCGRVIGLVEEEIEAGRTVMILGTCNFVIYPIIKKLKEMGIPFHNPYRPDFRVWNPLAPSKKKITPRERILSFLKPDVGSWGSESRDWDGKDLNSWMSALRQEGILRRGVKAQIAAKGFVAPTNWEDLKKLFVFEKDADKALRLDIDWWERSLMGSQIKSHEYPLKVARAGGGKALWKVPKVIVSTIHGVKGGEADTVIVFPDISKSAEQARIKKGGEEDLARLFYVAVTRAKDKLVLCKPDGWGFRW